MKQQCIKSVEQAIGRKLKAGESQDIEKKIIDAKKQLARGDRQKWQQMTENERLIEASKIVGMDALAEVKRKNKILAQDILAQSKNLEMLQDPNHKLPARERLDRMIAPFGDMSGIQSLDSKSKAIAALYRGELTDMYVNIKGALGLYTDKDMINKVVRQLFKEDTGDATAKKIADKMSDVFENMRQRFNRSGGDIGKLDDWGLPQTHNTEKLLQVGKEQWVDYSLERINRDKYVNEDGTLYSEKQLRELLEHSYQTIATNGANKLEIGRQNTGGGTSKTTNKHSEGRVLHFKDADAWLDYQSEFGGMSFVDLVESHVTGMSKDIALVENLGSNPKNAMRILTDSVRRIEADQGIEPKKTDKTLNRAQTMFDEFMGSNRPESEVLANVGLAYRSMNVASMLGGTTITSITDQAMTAKTASIHNIAYRKVFGELVRNLNPANSADRELAHSLGLATQEMLGSIARWSDDGLTSVHGKAAKLATVSNAIATTVMRASGLNHLTAANKIAFSKMLMDKYGRMTREKSWPDLHADDRAMLEAGGMSEADWNVWQLANPIEDFSGNQLLTARSIYEIPDADFLTAIDKDVKALVDDIDSQVHDLNSRNQIDDDRIAAKAQRTDDLKQQLSQRLQDYANRKDTKSQAEKQALQDRIDLLDAQKESAAALADMNAYMRTVENQDSLKGFMDNITQGKEIDRIAARSEKLGKELQKIDNRVSQETARLSKMINGFEKEIQAKFKDFDELLSSKKIDAEKLAEYEAKLAERLNTYSTRRDIKSRNEVNALEKLKELSAAKQEQLKKSVEIDRAVAQTKMKNKTDAKIDSSIERNARQDYRSGESIGQRIGSAERRIVELRAKMRNADSEANKAITKKFNDLDKRVRAADDEYAAYATKVNERQEKRSQVADRLNKSIDAEKLELVKRKKDEMATRLQTHILDEQGFAVLEAGLRERTMMQVGKRGSAMGEIVRSMLQFKSFPMALLMRHGSRAMAQDSIASKAWYAASLMGLTTLLGGLVVQLKELARGNDPQDMTETDFMKKSFITGGGLPILGDIIVAGADTSGRDAADFMIGPLGSDIKTLMNVTVGNATKLASGEDTNAGNEIFKMLKNKIPAQNLWYTKAATDRFMFDQLQDIIAPGHREKLKRKAERDQNRTSWLGDFDYSSGFDEFRAPDFEKAFGD